MYSDKDHTFAICAYKDSEYLEECINSLCSQNIKTNIILCTSTPSDFIYNLSQKYRIKIFVNKSTGRIADDWNFALKCAKTDIVTIAHQDDLYFPDYTKEIIRFINRAPKPLIAFSDYCEIRNGVTSGAERNLKIKRLMLYPLRAKKLWNSRFIRRRILSFGSAICCPSVTYVKPNIPENLFDNSYKVSLDWNAWERLSKLKGEFVFVNRILMGHRIHENSETTKNIVNSNRSKEDYLVFCKFWPKYIASIIGRIYKRSEIQNRL